MERTRLLIQIYDSEAREQLCRILRAWMALYCASMELTAQPAGPLQSPAVLFWDLDGGEPPPRWEPETPHALIVCSADPTAAIRSYPFHPTAFLPLPASMDQVEDAMKRCAPLWWNTLDRLEILSGRVRTPVPFCSVTQVEGTRKGCLVHSLLQTFSVREPLYGLESRLPPRNFVRCQRSFVVNLLHIQKLTRQSALLTNGAEISLGRLQKDAVWEAYRQFRLLREGKALGPTGA